MGSLNRMEFRVGTVLLFFTMMISSKHGIMETATTIYLTGYVRWSQSRHETSGGEITKSGQIICVVCKNLSNKLTAASMVYVSISYTSGVCGITTDICAKNSYSIWGGKRTKIKHNICSSRQFIHLLISTITITKELGGADWWVDSSGNKSRNCIWLNEIKSDTWSLTVWKD